MILIAKPPAARVRAILNQEERAFHRAVEKRQAELMKYGVEKQEAWDRAWIDCGGVIVRDGGSSAA